MDVLYVCCHGGLSISYVNNEKSGIFSVLFLLTDVEDVNNKGNEEVLPSILPAILKMKFTGEHEETDSEMLDELQV
ncbi:hypothetical protein M9H77_13673 [Catharanthus roseus]|uniref:Uncharacterized protein n=1 Tax=Catharanthus roseus TaxID=4058 RepID=A0ACC0BKU1_CATRO|nr:hypothetical protein M9H77_13673 [Catharanthus roseus]